MNYLFEKIIDKDNYALICHSLPEINTVILEELSKAKVLLFPWERDLSYVKTLLPNSITYLYPYPIIIEKNNKDINNKSSKKTVSIFYEGVSESRLHSTLSVITELTNDIELICSKESLPILIDHLEALNFDVFYKNRNIKIFNDDKQLIEIIQSSSIIIYPHYSAIKPISMVLLYSWALGIPIISGLLDELTQFPNIIRQYSFTNNEKEDLKRQLELVLYDQNATQNIDIELELIKYIEEHHDPVTVNHELNMILERHLYSLKSPLT